MVTHGNEANSILREVRYDRHELLLCCKLHFRYVHDREAAPRGSAFTGECGDIRTETPPEYDSAALVLALSRWQLTQSTTSLAERCCCRCRKGKATVRLPRRCQVSARGGGGTGEGRAWVLPVGMRRVPLSAVVCTRFSEPGLPDPGQCRLGAGRGEGKVFRCLQVVACYNTASPADGL